MISIKLLGYSLDISRIIKFKITDSMIKAFIPFTNMRKIVNNENVIDDMLKEIMRSIIKKEHNILIVYPLDDRQRRQRKFQEIMRIAQI